MYHIKDDQRAIRSSEMIYEGLAKLMHEQDFNAITVTNLVEAAGVGRTTFYRNFDDIEDVLYMRCDRVFEGLVDYIQEYRRTQPQDNSKMLKPVLRYFYLHSELIELLILAKRIDILQESFRTLMEPFKFMFEAFYSIEGDYVDYLLTIRIGVITNILSHWVKTGKKQSPDELADKLTHMLSNHITLI